MTNQNDPIAQIKKAEQDSKNKIEQEKKNLEEQLRSFSEELEKKTTEFEEGLREGGLEKLQNVKKEASELLKSKMATAESQKNKLTSEAKGKQGEAVKEVVSIFQDHVKA